MRQHSSHAELAPGPGAAAVAVVLAVVGCAVGLFAAVALPVEAERADWLAFGVLAPAIAFAHLLGADRARHQGSHLSLAPIFASVLLLPPTLAVLAILAAFAVEWARIRMPWYMLAFNVANFVGPALAGRVVYDEAGAVPAILVFLTLHYGFLAAVLRFARGVAPAETLRPDCVLVDAGLVSLGAIGAALWDAHPGLVALTLVPLALAYRSLSIPALVEATRIEPKTGLYNLRHFRVALAQELGRSGRFGRSLAVLMVDVDHLRDVNTAHGHLAGDRALVAVARSLRAATREYDVPARFGGDEFCVLLPETELEGALAVAERIRAEVEETTRAEGVPVTVSVGVVARGGESTPEELLALADEAAYTAKASGRNAVAFPSPASPGLEAERLLEDVLGA
jgi:diguanylate cyclase (GGDEF)-like protein